MPARYYFHGDEIDNEPGQFYCAYCDLSVNEKHFSEFSHSGTDKDRYDRSVEGWKVLGKRSEGRLYRPSNSNNLFAHLPSLKKPKASPFYRWLMKQQDRDDPIGDLSNDVQNDKLFPVESCSLEKLRNRLLRSMACEEAFQALDEAFSEFKSKKKSRSGMSLSLRFNVFRRDEYRCQICGSTASDGVKLEVDHKIPVSKGGQNDIDNLWTLCFNCNRGKGIKNL